MKSICLISVYIGPFPWYFKLFLHSCKFNPSVDYLLFTDNPDLNLKLPKNVRIVYVSIQEINHIASSKLGFETKIVQPYKICDFKPSYGLLFDEYLIGFDFWGHIDIDIIFGDIRLFITNELLSKNDLICVRHDFLSGYFLLFKNTKKMNLLFTKSKDYKKVFSSDKHYCFDETNFHFSSFSQNLPLSEINSEIESMMHVVRKMELNNQIRTFFDFMVIEGLPGKLKWSNGKLFYKNKYEILLYHLILFKKVYRPKHLTGAIPNEFRISPTRIYHSRPK